MLHRLGEVACRLSDHDLAVCLIQVEAIVPAFPGGSRPKGVALDTAVVKHQRGLRRHIGYQPYAGHRSDLPPVRFRPTFRAMGTEATSLKVA